METEIKVFFFFFLNAKAMVHVSKKKKSTYKWDLLYYWYLNLDSPLGLFHSHWFYVIGI